MASKWTSIGIEAEAAMATTEERMKILKMVEEGTITAEEAARLLTALARSDRRRPSGSQDEARWLRVRVTDMESGKQSVNITLPMSLVNVGLRMGARFVPEMDGLQMEEIAQAVREGATGKIIDIDDLDEGQHVEVYLD
jgi:polyhydroxyalkanoate synthesis regulator phasin